MAAARKTAETKTISFAKERETKRMVRFTEQSGDEAPVIGTLYVNKEFAGASETLTVTLKK